MKKKIIGYIGMAVFAIAIAFNLYMTSSNTQTSSVVLENIEALADSTSGSGSGSISGAVCAYQCCDECWIGCNVQPCSVEDNKVHCLDVTYTCGENCPECFHQT